MKTLFIEARRRIPAALALPLILGLAGLGAGCAGQKDAKTAASEPSADAPASAETSDETAGDEAAPSQAPSQAEPQEAEPSSRSLQEAVAQELERADAAGEEAAPEDDRTTRERIDYPQPPDGEWLVDDEGQEYFVEEVPKVEGRYRRLEDDRIRLPYGMIADLAGETEDAFLIKVYKVEPVPTDKEEPATEEEIAAVAASFAADLPGSDRIVLEDFGEGLPKRGQWRNGLDVADMNGDGFADIVHSGPRKNPRPPVIFLGDGAGSWRVWEEVTFPRAPWDYGDVEAADLDGDGAQDLLVAVHLGGLTALRGDGAGSFVDWSGGLELVPAGGAQSDTFLSRTVTATDWNGDGRPDLVALSEGPRHPKATEREQVEAPNGVHLYENRGDGTWGVGLRLGADQGLLGDSLALGDFDGDGLTDLASATNALGLKDLVFLNREGWTAETVTVEELRPLAFVWSVAAADFDGDGLDDLVIATTAREVETWWWSAEVLLSRPDGDGLRFERVLLDGGEEKGLDDRAALVEAGDFDGDGSADVAMGTGDGRVRLFLGDGRGGFSAESTPEVATSRPGCRPYSLRAAQLDGEGPDELILGVAGERCPGMGSLQVWKSSPK